MTPQEAFIECYFEDRKILELEDVIATDPRYSYWYTRDVLKGPFHLCHPIIFNSEWKSDYLEFLKSINYDINEISEWLI